MADLASIVGAAHVVPDPPARLLADAADPAFLPARADWLVRPGRAEEVAEVLAWCAARGVPVTPRGGGTGLAGGAVPEHGGLVLETTRLRAIRAFAPEHRRLHVEAGLTTAEVRRLAGENGLVFGPDPGAGETSQIGGNVATNAGGPHSLGLGATREYVTGLEVALPPGELVILGSGLPRDAAGLDLVGLLTGSEGALGVVTAVDLRLRPAPEGARALRARYEDARAGVAAVHRVLGAGLDPLVLDFLDEGTPGADGRFLLLAETAGDSGELADALGPTAQEEDPARALGVARVVSRLAAGALGTKRSEDIAVPVARLAEAVAGVQELGGCSWGHAGDGILHATFLLGPGDPEPETAPLFALARELGGSPSGEHGTGRLKKAFRDPARAGLDARVKAALDPRGLMNPGVS